MLRVIAGSARGTKLVCPAGLTVRPTHDRVKEAVFSMLTGRIEGTAVLDAFAGTGALGIEALSRGAKHAVFVDSSSDSLQTVSANLEKTHLMQQAQMVKSDYLTYLTQTTNRFDLIFLDPPYWAGFMQSALTAIHEHHLLASDGVIYCESEDNAPAEAANLFQIVRDKKYGRAHVLLLKEF